MTRTHKALTITAWALAVIAMVSFVASGMWRRHDDSKLAEPAKLERYFQVPDFQLVNQDGKPFTGEDVAGKVWIADLVFTQCMGPCPAMTSAMADLQRELAGTGVQFVSVSVDPANDTPPVLKQYMQNAKYDQSNWNFLTGKPEEIFGLAKNLKVPAAPADEQNIIMHTEKFILIDSQGWIRGWYHYQEKRAELVRDARQLAAGKG